MPAKPSRRTQPPTWNSGDGRYGNGLPARRGGRHRDGQLRVPGASAGEDAPCRCPVPTPCQTGRMAKGYPYDDLKEFLAALESAGELHRVAVPVDPTLEISEIVTRTVGAKGPALLFEKPTRGQMPVAINLFGTERRMALALGVEDVNEIGARIGELIRPELPVGWAGIREGLGKLMQLKSLPPKRVRSAPCQEVVYPDVDLDRLPGLQTWPADGGIFHNFGLTHTKHPENGKRN